jgi:division protein CdvB (Snf7/Vps24/ESCRT-III family)
MKKLKKNHKKTIKKLQPGTRVQETPRTARASPEAEKTIKNLNAAISKMKSVQAEINSRRASRSTKKVSNTEKMYINEFMKKMVTTNNELKKLRNLNV